MLEEVSIHLPQLTLGLDLVEVLWSVRGDRLWQELIGVHKEVLAGAVPDGDSWTCAAAASIPYHGGLLLLDERLQDGLHALPPVVIFEVGSAIKHGDGRDGNGRDEA